MIDCIRLQGQILVLKGRINVCNLKAPPHLPQPATGRSLVLASHLGDARQGYQKVGQHFVLVYALLK